MKQLNLQKLEANLDQRMHQNLDACKIGGASVYVHQDGQPDFIRCYGKTNTDTGEAMNQNVTFRLASMTKPITAAAVLLQVQRGLLDLSAPVETYLPAFAFFLLAWWGTYELLVHFTNSDVPVLDAFTNALSFVGLWALSRKYVEQWAFWLIVDAICCYLYVVKGIPFKAGLYGLYTIIAVAGYCKWWKMAVRFTFH